MYKLLIVEDEELERQVLYKQICDSQLPVKIVRLLMGMKR